MVGTFLLSACFAATQAHLSDEPAEFFSAVSAIDWSKVDPHNAQAENADLFDYYADLAEKLQARPLHFQ